MNFSRLKKVFSVLTLEQKKGAFKVVFFMSIGTVLETIGIGLIIPTVAVIANKDVLGTYPSLKPFLELLGYPTHEQLCLTAVSVLVAFYLIKQIFASFMVRQEAKYFYGLQEELSSRLLSNYMYQPYVFHLNHNSSLLIRRITGEVMIMVVKVITPILKIFSELILLGGIASMLLFVEPVGAIASSLLLGFAGWIFHRMTKQKIREWGKQRQYHETQILLQLQHGFGGIKDAILLGCEESFVKGFKFHNRKRVRIGKDDNVVQQLPRMWIELIAVLGLAMIVWVMIYKNRALGSIVPILGIFAVSAFRLMPSVNRMITYVQSIGFGLPILSVLSKDLELPLKAISKNGHITNFDHSLKVHDLVYTYPNASQPSLNGISLEIIPKDSIGIVGESGSGKSTLVDAILGLHQPQKGEISVDGKDILSDLRGWQNFIGYVPQFIYLTDDSLRRNIAYGLPDTQIDDAAVQRALNLAQLDKFVSSLPEGLDTFVGERGVRLSGGQRQRIGIARALYHNPSILILDEATSSLDLTTEKEINHSVFNLNADKTLIIVAHRLSTVAGCKRIYHLEKGRIINQGSPEEVLPPTDLFQKVKRG